MFCTAEFGVGGAFDDEDDSQLLSCGIGQGGAQRVERGEAWSAEGEGDVFCPLPGEGVPGGDGEARLDRGSGREDAGKRC
jgi:hypothetical protein